MNVIDAAVFRAWTRRLRHVFAVKMFITQALDGCHGGRPGRSAKDSDLPGRIRACPSPESADNTGWSRVKQRPVASCVGAAAAIFLESPVRFGILKGSIGARGTVAAKLNFAA
jgi:hypothetical protein